MHRVRGPSFPRVEHLGLRVAFGALRPKPHVLAVLLAVVVAGCSPEGKAKRAFERYEPVFRACKEQTEREKMRPGEHRCASIASAAVDLGLEQTELQEPKRSEMLKEWLEKKKFVEYYVPRDKRPVSP